MTLAKERAANSHPARHKVAYLGIGNIFRRHAHRVRMANIAQMINVLQA